MKLFRNYKKAYEQASKLLDAALLEMATTKVENDRLHKMIEELSAINASQDAELRNVYGKIAVAQQALARAKK